MKSFSPSQIKWRTCKEEFIVLVVSFHYLLSSLLIVDPIRNSLHFSFSYAVLITLPAAVVFAVAAIITTIDKPKLSSLFSFDVPELPLVMCLFGFAMILLLPNVWRFPSTFDERWHMGMMQLALTQPLGVFIDTVARSGITIYSPWWYLAISSLLRLAGGVTLLGFRSVMSVASGFAAVAVYYLAKEIFGKGFSSVVISCVFVLSSVFHRFLFYGTMDGIATLMFTLSVCCLLRGLTRHSSFWLMLAGIFWSLLALAHYVPALQLVLGYLLSLLYLRWKQLIRVRDLVPLWLGFLLFSVLNFPMLPYHILRLIATGLDRVPILNPVQYDLTMIWDFLLSIGWSPYLVFLITAARRSSTDRVQARVDTVLKIIVGSSFLVYLLMNSLAFMRRLIPVSPVFLIMIGDYSAKNYSKITTGIILLNFCWWGLLQLFLGVIPGVLFG